jgi:hypothetical protein
MKGIKKIRSELFAKSRDEFQILFAQLLAEILEGVFPSKRMGKLDRAGIDAFLLKTEELAPQAVIQCKGFEEFDYGAGQHKQCLDEIDKFLTKGPATAAPEYWLVINRAIKDRTYRGELEAALTRIVAAGKAKTALLLDLEPMLDKFHELATRRLAAWAEAKRIELFRYYAERLHFVDEYIADVPFAGKGIHSNPVTFISVRLRDFFAKLRDHQTGPYRASPKLLITSSFGFGKTSALHSLARQWLDSGGHLIYAPAALLDTYAFAHGAGLANALLGFLLPEEEELSDTARRLFRDVIRFTLATSRDWIVLIDGLDENAAAFKPNSLATLWGSIQDLGVPAILAARDELVESRPAEFFPATRLNPAPAFERIQLLDWPDELILRFLDLFAASHGGQPPEDFRELRELVEQRRYADVYGDIPKRPLFLGMLAADAWAANAPARKLHRLYGKYFRQKFAFDRYSAAAGGVSLRPSSLVDTFGEEEALERLIIIMQELAGQMTTIGRREANGSRALTSLDAVTEGTLRSMATKAGVGFVHLEDVALHSLMQPAGRDHKTRERLLRFAHRSFQDWFLARYLAQHGYDESVLVPESAARFLNAIKEDLRVGLSLP